MTLDQLNILVNIVEQGSMGAAAKALFRTQPTLSVSIKKLEEEFDLELFSRSQRRMTLTPAGKAMYKKAKGVLEQVEGLENFGKQLAVGNEPEVTIAFDASIPIRFISSVLKRCEAKFPETHLNLVGENLNGVIERLIEKDADLAIVTYFEANHLFRAIPFHKYRYFPVAAAGYIPVEHDDTVPLEVMKQHVQVILGDSAKNASKKGYRIIDGARSWRVNNVQTKLEVILEGLGWGSLPDFMIQDELDNEQVIPLQIENYYRYGESELCVVCQTDQLFGPVVQHLWESFQELSGT